MAFYQLDDVFGYQDANAIKRLWASDADPETESTEVGEIWLDLSVNPIQLRRYTGPETKWEVVGGLTAPQLLEVLKTVDGGGSGLDADLLDGNDSDYYAIKQYTPVDGNTLLTEYPEGITVNPVVNDAPGWPVAAGVCVTVRKGSHRCCQLFFHSNGYLQYMRGYRADTGFTQWYKIWTEQNDGAGSGLDADKLDGAEGDAYVRSDVPQTVNADTTWADGKCAHFGSANDLSISHASDITTIDNNTGTLSLRQLAAGEWFNLDFKKSGGDMSTLMKASDNTVHFPKTGGAVYVGDNDQLKFANDGNNTYITNQNNGSLVLNNTVSGMNVAVYARKQDGTTQLMIHADPDITCTSFGHDQGVRIYNNASVCQLQTVNNPLTIRSFVHGGNVSFSLEDEAGTIKTMMVLDPDTEDVSIMGNKVWHAGNDGTGSGLNADLLHGATPSVLLDNNTIVQRSDKGYIYGSYFNTTCGNSVYDITHLYGGYDTFIRKVSATQLLTFLTTADGSGSGLDADLVDGVHASQFIRSDADDIVSGHTEWQDNYDVRLGTGADFRIRHDGTESWIQNYTGRLIMGSYSQGKDFIVTCRDTDGTDLTGVRFRPNLKTPSLFTNGAVVSQMVESFQINNGTAFDTGIPSRSTGYFMLRSNTAANACIFQICTATNEYVTRAAGSSLYTGTKDTDARTNVYFEGGTLRIQNLTGGHKDYYYGFFGMRFDG